jgi:hypothetical protein
MLISVVLDGAYHIPGMARPPLPHPEVTSFLKMHPTAKIIVVVDTHCLQESGEFVWSGSGSTDFGVCMLRDVSWMGLAHQFWPL